MAITTYPELVHEKGLALVRCDIFSPLLKKEDATRIWELFRRFYSSAEDYHRVQTFNHRPAEFDFNDYLRTVG